MFFNQRDCFTIRNAMFYIPAMFMAAKGFADLWISGVQDPYVGISLLLLTLIWTLGDMAFVSAFIFLSGRGFWVPTGELLITTIGIRLFLENSLGRTVSWAGVLATVGIWICWGFSAIKRQRDEIEKV